MITKAHSTDKTTDDCTICDETAESLNDEFMQNHRRIFKMIASVFITIIAILKTTTIICSFFMK